MSESKTIIEYDKKTRKGTPVYNFFRIISKLIFSPGEFYKELSREEGYTSAVVFLFSCSFIYSILAGLFVIQKKALFILIFFLNAFFLPFITALFLYFSTMILCRSAFSYQRLFGITAYANVTLLGAWIPGMTWIVGLWKFYLIGFGMVKAGGISGFKAFICLIITGAILLLLIQLLYNPSLWSD